MFYRIYVELWLKCKTIVNVDEIKNADNELIWNNENVKYNGKTLYFKHWIRNGFKKISSLYNNDGSHISVEYFNDKIKKIGGVILDHYTLMSSIPKSWRELKTFNSDGEFLNGITLKQIFYPLEQCNSKIMRCKLMSEYSVKPICQTFWEKKFPNYRFKWDVIWKNIPLHAHEARLITLNWKILCNIYPTNILLAKIGIKNTSKCETCNEEDYLEHFFFTCKNC